MRQRKEGESNTLEYWGGVRPLVRRLGRPPELMSHRDGIANELLAISYASVDDLMEWDENGKVTIKSTKQIPKYILKAVKKVKVTTDRDGNSTLELEMYDKIASLRVLARATGLLDKPEDEGDRPSVIGINLMGGEDQPVAEFKEVEDGEGADSAVRDL